MDNQNDDITAAVAVATSVALAVMHDDQGLYGVGKDAQPATYAEVQKAIADVRQARQEVLKPYTTNNNLKGRPKPMLTDRVKLSLLDWRLNALKEQAAAMVPDRPVEPEHIPATPVHEQRIAEIKAELADIERVKNRILVANRPRHPHAEQPILPEAVETKLAGLHVRDVVLQAELRELTGGTDV